MKPIFFSVVLSLALLGPTAPAAQAQVTLTWLAVFTGTNGATPEAALIQGRDGDFYGTAMQGGLFTNFGTVFKVTTNGTYTTLVSFNATNGAFPEAGLMQDKEGNLWGTTYQGGSNGLGTVFTIATNGEFTSTSFDLANDSPNSVLLQATDGLLYGTAQYGGSANLGTIFQLTPPGIVRTVAAFDGTNGSYPYDSGLVQGEDGFFYGSTPSGGVGFDSADIYSGWGTLLKASTNGPLTNLWKFDGTNGAFPVGVLTRGLDGSFYGVTSHGGMGFNGNIYSGFGTLFKITTNGSFTTLCYFDNLTNGANPFAGLVLGTDGNFYGTTQSGGTNYPPNPNNGTIFQMTPGGRLKLLISFDATNGDPLGGLVQGSDGDFYGTTTGGATSLGGVFRLHVPSASSPELKLARQPGGGVTLTWMPLRGRRYRLQTIPSPSQGTWSDVGSEIIATQYPTTITDDTPANGAPRFYRLVLLP